VPSDHFWLRADMTSSGFCLLNTVAVAAVTSPSLPSSSPPRQAYARYNFSILLSSPTPTFARGHTVDSRPLKIAIIDIDVHHGPSPPSPLAWPAAPHWNRFASGNGTEEIVRNLSPRQVHLPLPSSWAPISQLSYKPWLNETDPQDVFFSSIHLFAGFRPLLLSPDPPPPPSPLQRRDSIRAPVGNTNRLPTS
jgi:hypothetical protein